jgi:hypothetical protein
MNSITEKVMVDDRRCAGKECREKGLHYLEILYLNKSGWFCESCKDSLISNELVVQDDTDICGVNSK